jgi:hypothetical protein
MTTEVHSQQADGRTSKPGRRSIASYTSHNEAEDAVDRLARAGFPVERVAIVAHGLRMVEQVTGRITLGRAALDGALTGAFAGLMIGWLFAVFSWYDPTIAWGWLIFDSAVFGALLGAAVGMTIHALTRQRFGVIAALTADHYHLTVDPEVAGQAERILRGEAPANGAGATEGAGAAEGDRS